MLYAFDIDGTLIRSFIREVKSKHGSDLEAEVYDRVEALPGRQAVIATLARRRDACFALVTNQAGVAFGYQTSDQVVSKIGRVLTAFEHFHGRPVSVHYCFTHREATIEALRCMDVRRKPGPGMLREAMKAHGVDPEDTWYVGDMDADRGAAAAAKVAYWTAEEFFAMVPV